MKGSLRLLHCAAVIALAGTASNAAQAAIISNWNIDNVVTTENADADGNFFSSVYDTANTAPNVSADGANTNGYIKFTPPEGAAPGIKVVNDGSDNNCIMAAGDASCNSSFQSGKRFKLDRTALDPIDLVFNLEAGDAATVADTYRVFQKYGNNTDSALAGFSIELGFGIGDAFIKSADGDGLSFQDFGSTPAHNEFSSAFSQGLFGPVDTKNDRPQGYFSAESSGFELDLLTEDLFVSTGLFGGEYGYSALFGDWMPYSMVPDGYFYDHDGDPLTDAILMAHYDEATGQWIMNRTLDTDGTIVTAAQGNEGATYATITDVEDALITQADGLSLVACEISAASVACLAGVSEIEDLAKFNVSYFIDSLAFDVGDLADATFTMRITAQEAVSRATVPEPGTLALLAMGLGLLVRRRKFQVIK